MQITSPVPSMASSKFTHTLSGFATESPYHVTTASKALSNLFSTKKSDKYFPTTQKMNLDYKIYLTKTIVPQPLVTKSIAVSNTTMYEGDLISK